MTRLASGAVVCVPARNEAERLPGLLHSLAHQEGFDAATPLGVVIVANGCTDGTAEVARKAASEPTLVLRLVEAEFPPEDAHVGTARRLALDEGAAWLAAEAVSDGVLLSTDADVRLPADWVTANLAALRDAEIVGGALVIDPEGEGDADLARLHEDVARYWAAVRALEDRLDPPPHDPAPRHGDHTGASLALRADLYRAVGGLPPLPAGEDNALVARVVEAGGRLRHDPAIRVFVSDRAIGRCDGGMALDMARRRAAAGGEGAYRLPHPAHWRDVIACRARLRAAWRRGPAAATLALRGLDAAAISAVDVAGCPNDIAFVERTCRLLRALPARHAEVPVEVALRIFAAEDGAVRGAP